MAGGTTNRAGDIVTPSEASPDWLNARVLLAKDSAGNYRLVGVDENGRVLTDAELQVGDIQIGAVELKDYDSDVRADILAAGGLNSLAVTSGTLATQATLAAVLAALGPLATQATLATRATEATVATLGTQVTLAAVQTLIDNLEAAIDAAAPSNVMQVGGQIKTAVPTAGVNNALVPLLVNTYRELILAGYNRSQGSIDTSQVAATKIPPIIETGWTALTVAGTFTPWRDVRDLTNHTIEYIISSIGTSVALRFWGAIAGDQSNPFLLTPTLTVLAADDQTDAVKFSNTQVTHIRCELETITGGSPSVVFYLTDGNSA